MRTLKKALSLVLVLAMVFALAVPGFAADTTKKASDYKDYSKVTNKEAVDVLTAIGVINGNADGTFAPEGNFTRAEAATLITYLTLGKTVADALPNTTCKFADVPAWAAKYVQYCANEGIVVGYDAKTFGANDPLTAAQWALMLLKAAGAKGVEEINADNFALATTKLAVSTGLATPDDMAATFNRDAAAKLALNGLFYSETTAKKDVCTIVATNVENAGKGIATVDGEKFDSFSEAYLVATNAKQGADTFKIVKSQDEVKTNSLADKVFKLSTKTETDALGRTVKTYTSTLKSLKDLSVKAVAQADYVIKGAISEKALYNMVGYKAAGYTWTNLVDGVDATTKGATPDKNKTTDFQNTANGTVSYVYVDNDKSTVKFCVANTFVGEVKKVTEAKDGVARFVTLTNGVTFTTDNFAAKDVVLYTAKNGTKVAESMELAQVVTGTLTKIATIGSDKTYTVNGTAYAESKMATGVNFENGNIGKEVSFYVDAQGNVIMNKSAAATATNYIFVVASSGAKTGDYMTGAKATLDAYGVNNAGEVVTLTVDHVGDTEVASQKANEVKGLYTYTKNSNGNYTIKAESAAAAENLAKNDTTVKYDTDKKAVMNSATQYIFITTESATNKNVKNVQTITGNANIAPIAKENAFVAAENGVAKYVFVNTAAATAVTDTTKVVYVTTTGMVKGTEIGENGTPVDTYTYPSAWTVDGKLANGIVGKDKDLTGLFYINDDNTIGSEIKDTATGVITAINGNVVTITKDSKNVYLTITDKTAEIFAAEDVELKVGQSVTYKTNGTVKSNLDVVIVTGDQVTYTLTVNGDGVTTTAYEVIAGAGVVNTIKLNGATTVTKVTTKDKGTDKELTADTDYKWTAKTNTLTVNGDKLTGAVVITAAK